MAHNGADALTAVTTLRPDLILLDVHLPDMSGLDVLREARSRHPEVDVILVTAAHELDVVRRAWQGGALSYLVKPFEYEALAERLEHFRANRAMLAAPDVDQGQDRPALRGVRGGPRPDPGRAAQGPEPGDRRAGAPVAVGRRAALGHRVRGAGRAVPGQRPPLPGLPGGDRRGPVQLKYGRTGRPERLYRLR